MLDSIVDWAISLMETLGAPGVGIAILLENLFPPIPSEVILPLAGFTSSQGTLNFWAALIWATAGSVVGAYLLYWLGAAVGADRLRRIADRMWLVEAGDVDKSLRWFTRFGQWSVFFGRFIPGIRSLISIPAGVDRMNLLKFGLLTMVGSAIWNAVLIACGVWLGESWETVSRIFDQYSTVAYVLIGIALIAGLAYLIVRSQRRRNERAAAGSGDTTR